MATDSEDVILNIVINNEDAIMKIAKNQQEVDKLKQSNQELSKSNQELSKQVKAGAISQEEASKKTLENNKAIASNKIQIGELSGEMRVLEKEIRNNIKASEAQEGSLNQMKAVLSSMTAQYGAMSEAERNSAKGKELTAKINETTDAVKAAENEIQIYNRSVGDYTNAINSSVVGNNKFLQSLLSMSQASNTAGTAFGGMGKAVTSMGKAMYAAIVANPVLAAIAAIVAILTGLVKVMKGNEEQSVRLAAVMAPLKRIFEGLMSVLQMLAGIVLSVAEGYMAIATAAMKMMEYLPFVGDAIREGNEAMEAAIQLEKDKAALDKQNREDIVELAKLNIKEQEASRKALEKDRYSAEERLKFNKEAQDAANERTKIEEAALAEKLRIMKEEASYNETSKEGLDAIAQAEADLLNLRASNLQKTKRLVSQEQSIIAEAKADAKAAHDEEVRRHEEYMNMIKERKKTEKDLVRQTQDMYVQYYLTKDAAEIETMKNTTRRSISELKEKLTTEKNLTVASRKAINDQIAILQLQLDRDIESKKQEQAQASFDEEFNRIQANIQNRLSAVQQGSDAEFELKKQLLANEQAAEVANAEKTGLDVEAVYTKHLKQLADLDAEQANARREAAAIVMEEEWNSKIVKAYDDAQALAQIEVDMAMSEHEQLLSMDQAAKDELGYSQLAYETLIIESENRIAEAKNNQIIVNQQVVDSNAENMQKLFQSTGMVAGGFRQMFEALSSDGEQMAGFIKSLALFEIAANLASGIANAVNTATRSSATIWDMIAGIAIGIATVTGAITAAANLFKKEKQPKKPKFAQGGLVEGAGSGTSDSIDAKLSNGESVITARATSMFPGMLSMINQTGGGVSIYPSGVAGGGDMALVSAIVEGISNIQPVVSVEEITRVEMNVRAIRNASTIQ